MAKTTGGDQAERGAGELNLEMVTRAPKQDAKTDKADGVPVDIEDDAGALDPKMKDDNSAAAPAADASSAASVVPDVVSSSQTEDEQTPMDHAQPRDGTQDGTQDPL